MSSIPVIVFLRGSTRQTCRALLCCQFTRPIECPSKLPFSCIVGGSVWAFQWANYQRGPGEQHGSIKSKGKVLTSELVASELFWPIRMMVFSLHNYGNNFSHHPALNCKVGEQTVTEQFRGSNIHNWPPSVIAYVAHRHLSIWQYVLINIKS